MAEKFIKLGENSNYELGVYYFKEGVYLKNKKTNEITEAKNDRIELNNIISKLKTEDELINFANNFYGEEWKEWRRNGGFSTMEALITWGRFCDRLDEVRNNGWF